MAQLLPDEIIYREISVGSERFTITDKRLLYSDGVNDDFIRINELRGSNVTQQDIKFDRFNLPPYQSVSAMLSVISIASVYVYYCRTKPEYQFGDLSPFFVAIFWSFGIVPIGLLLIYMLKTVTTYTEKKMILNITKTDNTFFANQYYDLQFSSALKQLEREINVAIYR